MKMILQAKAHKLKTKRPGNGGNTSSGRGEGGAESERRRFESNQPSSDLAPTSSLRLRSAPPLMDEDGTNPRSGGSARLDDFERVTASIRSEVALLELEASALIATAVAGSEYAGAIKMARKEAELLHAAQQAGRQITPALRAEVRALAKDYAGAATPNRTLISNATTARFAPLGDVLHRLPRSGRWLGQNIFKTIEEAQNGSGRTTTTDPTWAGSPRP